MMHRQISDSAGHAQAILGAWVTGDIQRFCHELNCVGSEVGVLAATDEEERMELLHAIAAELRVPSLHPPVDDASNIYSTLLHHLAFSENGALSAILQ